MNDNTKKSLDMRRFFERSDNINKAEKNPVKGGCFYRECSSPPIKSHLISKSILNIISTHEHVITFHVSSDRPEMKKESLGVKKVASVFPGFCELHDNGLFLSIDSTTIELSSDSACRIAYRSSSQHAIHKLQAIKANSQIPSRDPAYNQATSDNIDFRMQYNFLEKFADDALTSMESKNQQLIHDFVTIDRIVPFAVSAVITPFIKANGKVLGETDELIAISVLPQETTTLVVFSRRKQEAEQSERLLESVKHIPSERFADWLFRYCLETTEKIYITPSWWDALSVSQKDLYLRVARPSEFRQILKDRVDLKLFLSGKRRVDIKGNIFDWKELR